MEATTASLLVSARSGWPPVDGCKAGQALPTHAGLRPSRLLTQHLLKAVVQSLSCVFCWVSWPHTCWDQGSPASCSFCDSHACPVPPSLAPPPPSPLSQPISLPLSERLLWTSLLDPVLIALCRCGSVLPCLRQVLSCSWRLSPWPSANSLLRPLAARQLSEAPVVFRRAGLLGGGQISTPSGRKYGLIKEKQKIQPSCCTL